MTSATTDRRMGLSGSTAIKTPVACATTANIVLSGEQTIDGFQTNLSRVLVKNQADPTTNGFYDSNPGTWTRCIDANGNQDLTAGTIVLVFGGTANASSIWELQTANPITVGTTALSFGVIFNIQSAINAVLKTSATGSVIRPYGTTAQQDGAPTPFADRGNSTKGLPEWYDTAVAVWVSYGGEQAPEVSIVASATPAIGAASSTNIVITGNTGITAFDVASAGTVRKVRFTGTPLITYNAASMILPGAANMQVAAGDCAEFESLGGGNWVMIGL